MNDEREAPSATSPTLAPIDGYVAPGFEPVLAQFERNFTEHGEGGAAFAVVLGGEEIVDLWGGWADRAGARAWSADTLQIIFSGTKGLVAACALLLLDRGALDLAAPVATYWPEFAIRGKENVTVRDVLTHSAGLPGLDTPVTWQQAMDGRRMANLLADQPQSKDERAVQTYHALTYGWLVGEIVRRISGRSIGRFFAEEIGAPLGLDLWIGLPPTEEHRVSKVELAETWGKGATHTPEDLDNDVLLSSIAANPVRYRPESFPWNKPAWHSAEVPAVNAIGTARSLAK
ncbi:MAG TPA: serine hydrolase domain-containing protein, partial [Acidimicrobiales bacterium]|nr:serine hydrolase domain-containing protein [Acidimicrobiales bacterium]